MSCETGCPTCEALRASALEIVYVSGLETLTAAVLAERADVPVREVMRHYSSASACLLDAYGEILQVVRGHFALAFAEAGNWPDGMLLGARRLLEWFAVRPAEARLCFVEILRGERELLRARETVRRRLVDLLAREHRARRRREGLPEIQMEMLIGASFQAIGAQVAAGRTADLPELEDELVRLAHVFAPVPA